MNTALVRAALHTNHEPSKTRISTLKICLSLQTQGSQLLHSSAKKSPKGLLCLRHASDIRITHVFLISRTWFANMRPAVQDKRTRPASSNVRPVFPMLKLKSASSGCLVFWSGNPSSFRLVHSSRKILLQCTSNLDQKL